MSLLVAAALLTTCAVSAGLLARRWRRRIKPSVPNESRQSWPFPIQVGDVVVIGDDQHWLEQGWLLLESEVPIAALCFAGSTAVLSLRRPAMQSFVLSPVTFDMPEPAATAIEVSGERFERQWRLPVRVMALSNSEGPLWPEALFCYYRGSGQRVLFVLGREREQRAWAGRRVLSSELDVWGKAS